MRRLVLLTAAALALACSTAAARTHHAWHRTPAIVALFNIPAQHHPKMPAYHSPTYTCTTGTLGDQLCCVWRILYPGYGFGVWDCTVVPAARSKAISRN